MANKETTAIVDSDDLRTFKEKITSEIESIIDSFDTMYNFYEGVVSSGWDDDNQEAFEEEISKVKESLVNDITEFKDNANTFLNKKIEIIEQYCSFDM